MSDSTIYTHYRCQNGDGTSKDWAIGISGQEVRIRYCATGQTARLSVVPASKFVGRSADEEVANRVQKKLDAGYLEIGLACMDGGRLKETQPLQETFLHWEARIALPKDELLARCREIETELAELELGGVNVSTLDGGLQVTSPQREWHFGFGSEGGLTDDGRGGGKISRFCGPVPVLVLLTLDRAFPGTLHFANDQGEQIRPSLARDDEFLGHSALSSFERIMEIGAALGLCLGPLRFVGTTGSDQDPSLWF